MERIFDSNHNNLIRRFVDTTVRGAQSNEDLVAARERPKKWLSKQNLKRITEEKRKKYNQIS